MSKGENRGREVPFDQIKANVVLALKEGLMKSYVLKGPDGEENQVRMAVLLRENCETRKIELTAFIDEEDSRFTSDGVGQKINDLMIFLRLRNGHGQLEDLKVFKEDSDALREKETPFIMLEVGKSEQTQQEMIVLYVVNGITLETAITGLQDMYLKIKGKRSEQQG